MPDMTNAEAAKELFDSAESGAETLKHCTSGGDFTELELFENRITALRMGAAALTAPGWIRTADRLPEEKDGKDFLTHDIAWHREGESAFSVISLADLLYYRGDEYDYWMPLPPLPEVDT